MLVFFSPKGGRNVRKSAPVSDQREKEIIPVLIGIGDNQRITFHDVFGPRIPLFPTHPHWLKQDDRSRLMRSGQACCHTSKITSSSGEAKLHGKLTEEIELYEGWLKNCTFKSQVVFFNAWILPQCLSSVEEDWEPQRAHLTGVGQWWGVRMEVEAWAGWCLVDLCVAGSSRIWLDHNRGTTDCFC